MLQQHRKPVYFKHLDFLSCQSHNTRSEVLKELRLVPTELPEGGRRYRITLDHGIMSSDSTTSVPASDSKLAGDKKYAVPPNGEAQSGVFTIYALSYT